MNYFSESWMDFLVPFEMVLKWPNADRAATCFLCWWQRCKTEQALCSKPANVYPCLLSFGSREACNEGEGDPPLYVNVNMFTGQLMNTWIDSLQAFFPGLQVK